MKNAKPPSPESFQPDSGNLTNIGSPTALERLCIFTGIVSQIHCLVKCLIATVPRRSVVTADRWFPVRVAALHLAIATTTFNVRTTGWATVHSDFLTTLLGRAINSLVQLSSWFMSHGFNPEITRAAHNAQRAIIIKWYCHFGLLSIQSLTTNSHSIPNLNSKYKASSAPKLTT